MRPTKLLQILSLLSVVIIFTQCTSNEIGESKDVSQDKIYQSYFINYDATQDNASVTCHYRFAGKDGTTLVLTNPSNVIFDGTVLKVDSSASGGAYYQINKSSGSFFGKHSIVFSDINNKKFVNEFSFDGFKFINTPASAPKNQPLRLNFETTPLKNDDYIELSSVNTDSSFTVSHAASDTGNYLTVPAKELGRQKSSTLELRAVLHRQIPLQQATSEGGKMSIYYALKPIKINLK